MRHLIKVGCIASDGHVYTQSLVYNGVPFVHLALYTCSSVYVICSHSVESVKYYGATRVFNGYQTYRPLTYRIVTIWILWILRINNAALAVWHCNIDCLIRYDNILNIVAGRMLSYPYWSYWYKFTKTRCIISITSIVTTKAYSSYLSTLYGFIRTV